MRGLNVHDLVNILFWGGWRRRYSLGGQRLDIQSDKTFVLLVFWHLPQLSTNNNLRQIRNIMKPPWTPGFLVSGSILTQKKMLQSPLCSMFEPFHVGRKNPEFYWDRWCTFTKNRQLLVDSLLVGWIPGPPDRRPPALQAPRCRSGSTWMAGDHRSCASQWLVIFPMVVNPPSCWDWSDTSKEGRRERCRGNQTPAVGEWFILGESY